MGVLTEAIHHLSLAKTLQAHARGVGGGETDSERDSFVAFLKARQQEILHAVHETYEEERKMPNQHLLDVREVVPRERHTLIFDTFAALKPGDTFVLVNDHDPRPLYYQFEAEHTGQFSWEYLEQGPVVWRVRIGRRA
jgi:uncharacterized protein (DUF2249 family)